jgi:hypothetical protein
MENRMTIKIRAAKRRKPAVSLEEKFLKAWRSQDNWLAPMREYRFDEDRKWRFDFAWIIPQRDSNGNIVRADIQVAVEIEGGVFRRGRHTRGKGFSNDCDKYNAAVSQGWRILRYTDKHLTKKRIKETIRQVAWLLS